MFDEESAVRNMKDDGLPIISEFLGSRRATTLYTWWMKLATVSIIVALLTMSWTPILVGAAFGSPIVWEIVRKLARELPDDVIKNV